MSWREIGKLPWEEQEAARRALERRAGPTPKPRGPWRTCDHPPEIRVTVVPDPMLPESQRSEIVFCPLCGDDPDDRARAVLGYLRFRPNDGWTVEGLARALRLEIELTREAMARLEAGGFLERVKATKLREES